MKYCNHHHHWFSMLLAVAVTVFWTTPTAPVVQAFASRSSSQRPALINGSGSSHSKLLLAMSSSPEQQQPQQGQEEEEEKEEEKKVIPITLLSGFLGSGKTTTLKHLLENCEGIKIGVIVNDVASVNIDAKLVSNINNANNLGIVELQNGCACCSLADELINSVEALLDQKMDLDALVVELSGVADPVAIRANWQTATWQRHPVTRRADIVKVVTLVDAGTFGTDYMTWQVAGEREGWTVEGDDCAARRHVPELLAEQVEAADLILVNKIDLAEPAQVQIASSVARGLNAKAILQQVNFGQVSPSQLLELPATIQTMEQEEEEDVNSHDHNHDCAEPDCTDDSHSHSHDHAATAEACNNADCTDQSHSHSHNHDDENNNKNNDVACQDADCMDTSHSHSHSHQNKKNTSTDKLGIVNFVYKAMKPFHAERLMALLSNWPVPVKDYLDLDLLQAAQSDGYRVDGEHVEHGGSPFVGVLRSKGFCWLAPIKWNRADVHRHDTAMYWSHAGRHFGISSAGKWWGTVPKEQMKKYFADEKEYDRILERDFVTEEFGDRRQEIVFIGTNLDEACITKALDDCLCTDKEMDTYRQKLRNFMETTLSSSRRSAASPIGASLFDVVGTQNIDTVE